MKKENYTSVLEFTITNPTNDMERVGERLELSMFGEYCPKKSARGYNLLFLLDHPKHYRVSKIIMKGIKYVIPADRNKNYYPLTHPDLAKYIVDAN